MAESRTRKASRNVAVGIASKLAVMLFAFATKTLFVRLLGAEYNGVNGLYGNILSVLALSELGIGNVLNYALYSALRDGDTEKVRHLVRYFRSIYLVIAVAVSVVGLALVPFLGYVVRSALPKDELVTYYILFLVNSVSSYLVVYKTTVIIADQNNYISSACETVTTISMYVAQIIYLCLCRDFLGYLIIQVACTILKNVALSCIANAKYPYLRQLGRSEGFLKDEDRVLIAKNIKSSFLYKISSVVLNNTDNILISIIVGTVFVGYYSNYYTVVSYITSFVSIFITGIIASIGNLNAGDDREASYELFNILCLLFSFIGAVFATCLINCFQPFVSMWIGPEYVMGFSWVVVITLNLYLNTLMNPIWMYRETMGLFREVRFLMLATAGLNILFSVALGNAFGVPGILAATFIAKLVSQYWYEPIILFRKLGKPVRYFYLNQLWQFCGMLVATLLSFAFCRELDTNAFGIALRVLVSIAIAIPTVFIFNCKSRALNQLIVRYITPVTKRMLHMGDVGSSPQ